MRHYETAFQKATRVSLKLLPPDAPAQRLSFGQCENPFCALIAGAGPGCAACWQAQERALRGAHQRLKPQQVSCFAGLTDVAVPVLAEREHVATLVGGQVFRREPTERDFELVLQMLGGDAMDESWKRAARNAYFETTVVTADQFQAIVQLLGVFAQQLGDIAARSAIAWSEDEPPAVASAKRFVQSHAEDPITLEQVVQHVHVSRFYFCKIFKKATGMTLTQYVTRVRLEKAKSLLTRPFARVSEVVFAAGFGSIPQFNSVFKRHVGMAPTEYKASMRSQIGAGGATPPHRA